ncbi:MAG: hypothetical protein ACOCX3_00245 [Chloroflexota bacterium]
MRSITSSVLLILLLLTSAVTGVLAQSEDTQRVPVTIDNATVTLTDDGPVLDVQGGLGTGCELPVTAMQRVEGTTLFVEIYQEVPVDVICPMILLPYMDMIPLAPTDGIEQVNVNGTVIDISTGAQAASTETRRVDHLIESVTLQSEPDGYVLQIRGIQPDGCEFPTLTEESLPEQDWFRVAIFRELPVDIDCPDVVIDFEITVPLPFDLPQRTDGGPQIGMVVADPEFVLGAEATPEATPAVVPQPDLAARQGLVEVNDYLGVIRMQAGLELVEAERDLMVIEMATLNIDDNSASLDITGTFEDGCEARVRTLVEHGAQQDEFTVTVFRAVINQIAACPAIMRTYNTEVNLGADLPRGTYTYVINDGPGGIFTIFAGAAEEADAMQRSLHVIERVEPQVDRSGDEPVVTLEISGYIPDGCEAETKVDIQQVEDTISVEVYRLLPPGIMCTAVIQDYRQSIEIGALPTGTYTINVNDMTATLELSTDN